MSNKVLIEDVCTNELAEDIVTNYIHSLLAEVTGKGLFNEIHYLC